MKGRKEIAALQARARAPQLLWPNAEAEEAFSVFSRALRDIIFQNLTALRMGSGARDTWTYDPYQEEWSFTVSESLVVEVKSGSSRNCVVETTFSCHRIYVTADLEMTISNLNDDIEAWRSGLIEMRKLQLQRVRYEEGDAAYTAAVERST